MFVLLNTNQFGRRVNAVKAAVLYEVNKPLKIEEFELPETGPDMIRVRLAAAGVCHSDWHVVETFARALIIPWKPGHGKSCLVWWSLPR